MPAIAATLTSDSFLISIVGVYLPANYRVLSNDFYQDILEGKKGFILAQNVTTRVIPNWPELSVKKALD